MPDILVLHGPNLNLLGDREPGQYGRVTLEEIDRRLEDRAGRAGRSLAHHQSNAEHELVGRIQAAPGDGVRWILINPGAFTHTSVAIRDALLAVAVPFVEVHLSNIHAREPFRRHSYLSDISAGVVTGLGAKGYELALESILERLEGSPDTN